MRKKFISWNRRFLIIVKSDSEGWDFYVIKEMCIRKMFLILYIECFENVEKFVLCCVGFFYLLNIFFRWL